MKKNYSKNAAAIIITLIIILFACTKNNNIQPGPGTGNSSVQGVITDLNNSPVSNATVASGTATATTDASGKFTLTKVQFNSDTVVLKVTKDGFFEGSKKIVSSNHNVSSATIQVIPKTVSGSFSATSGGNITIAGGGSINFSPGFVTASNGNAYTGNVSVSAYYLDPSDQNFSAYAPGDLKAVSSDNPVGTLQSFGAVLVEMNDGAGNKLQLANGNTATITTPIPSALPNIASSSMPLWYFDDTKGTWKQQGVATKQGSNYISVVNHFSSWNSGYLVDSSQYIRLTIDGINYSWTLPNYVFFGYARPDSAGSISYTDIYSDTLGKNPAFDIALSIGYANASSGNVPAGNYSFGLYAGVNREDYNYTTVYSNSNPQTNVTDVTEYGPVGGYITGSASGSAVRYHHSSGSYDTTILPFTCTYKVLRIQ